jgi:hypothetical protein
LISLNEVHDVGGVWEVGNAHRFKKWAMWHYSAPIRRIRAKCPNGYFKSLHSSGR